MSLGEPNAQKRCYCAGVKIAVKVVPNASRDQVVGWLGEALKVRVNAPPEAGKANQRLCRLLAQFCGLPEEHVSVVAGHGSARKTLELRGMERGRLQELLGSIDD